MACTGDPLMTPKRVLVVEDDADIADLICLHLRDEHYEVVHAPTAMRHAPAEQQAWDALSST